MVKVRIMQESLKRSHACIGLVFTKEWTTLSLNQVLGITGSTELDIKFDFSDEDELLNLPPTKLDMLVRDFRLNNGDAKKVVKQLLPVKKTGLKTKAASTAKIIKETVL